MGLFDETDDPLGGAALETSPALATTGPSPEGAAPAMPAMPMPDISNIVATAPMPPRMAVPPPVGAPPMPMQDPRQKLLALFTTMFALGAGPHSGAAAGALRGLNIGQQALQADQMERWKWQAGKTEQERQRILTQQAIEDRQAAAKHEQVLTQNIAAFKQQMLAAKSKEEYDRLADAYGNMLQGMGYRISPNWFRSQIPYKAPTKQALADDTFQSFMKNPSNVDLVNRNPEKALAPLDQGGVAVAVDLNGDGVKEQVSLADLADMAGHGFARDRAGNVLVVPKPALTGTTPFVVKYNQEMDDFLATNHHPPKTKAEKDQIYADALEASKEKAAASPASPEGYLEQWAKEHGKQVRDLSTAEINTALKQHTDATQRTPILAGMNALYGMTDPKAIAAQIRAGNAPPDISQYGRPVSAAVASELAKPGPNGEKPFNLAAAQREWKAQINLNRTMNGAQQVRLDESIRSGLAMYDQIDQLADEWNGQGLGILSRANLRLAMEGAKGKAAQSLANRLTGQIAQLTSDVATIEQGGLTPTSEARGVAEKSLQTWWSTGTIKDMTAQGRYNMQIREMARRTQKPQTPGNPADLAPALPATPQGGSPARTQRWVRDPKTGQLVPG